MTPATQAQADALKRHLAAAHGVVFLDASSFLERELMVAAVEALRALNTTAATAAGYLARNALTVGPLVYLPAEQSPDAQIQTVACQVEHVAQWRRGEHDLPGGLGMFWLYLSQPEARVAYEAGALRAGLEVAWARARALPPLEALAAPLAEGYLLGDADVALGRDLLEVAATSVAQGVVATTAGHAVVEWMRREAPGLLAP